MSEDEGEWPEISLWDVSLDAFLSRLNGISDRLKSEADLSADFHSVIYPGNEEASEKIAVWLRGRVRELREFEDQKTAAPVRRGLSIGRAALNDLSFTLLENTDYPGPELLALIGELLGIDRHRQNLAKEVISPKSSAVWIEAQFPSIGVRDLAESLGVAPSSVTRWRQDPSYSEKVEFVKRSLKDDPLKKGLFKKIAPPERSK